MAYDCDLQMLMCSTLLLEHLQPHIAESTSNRALFAGQGSSLP